MKSFFKNVLANIVAIFLVGGIFIFFFFVLMLVGSLSGSDKVKVKEGTVLTFDQALQIIDSPSQDQDPFPFLSQNAPKKVLLYDVLEAIRKAKEDDKIKGISIETDFAFAGMTQLDNVRAALEDFKKSGKFVYGYGNMVSQGGYYLGSVAQQYYLNPMGAVELTGMASEVVLYKDFFEKYGVEVDVIRHGDFKAAVEPFLYSEISDENRLQLNTMLSDLWNRNLSQIASSRKRSVQEFTTVADSLYGILPENATKYGLADKLLQKSQYEELLKEKAGTKKDKDLERLSVSKYIDSYKEDKEKKDQRIAVLYASGAIYSGKGSDAIYSETFIEEIHKIKKDEDIKAVVLRINSPGGSANASDEILYELQELKKKKPIIVSFGDYAASGGYYIAMASDYIYSDHNTVTGSIGVFGMIPNVEKLAENQGIRSDIVQTNANAAYYTLLHGLTPSGRMMIQKSIEGTYDRFVHWVSKARKKSYEDIDSVGGGRIWSGTRAKEIGLVDGLGTLEDAIAMAGKKAKLKDYSIESFPKKTSALEQLLKDLNSQQVLYRVVGSLVSEDKKEMLRFILEPQKQSGVLMETPYRVKIN